MDWKGGDLERVSFYLPESSSHSSSLHLLRHIPFESQQEQEGQRLYSCLGGSGARHVKVVYRGEVVVEFCSLEHRRTSLTGGGDRVKLEMKESGLMDLSVE